ncbi:MAG: hypothetical protein IJ651_07140 [Bacteroidales bacterium]|nr:hypothetical protein [Bacteroidales bacterium]
MIKRLTLLLLIAIGLSTALMAQNAGSQGMPDDVYYLLPSFQNGYVYIRGQMPAQGKLNICAVDNSLRFMDDNGVEMEASDPDQILKVVIDTVSFLRYRAIFYRQYPVNTDIGVALRRKVQIISDQTNAAYGGTSRTSATSQYSTLYTEGGTFHLDQNKKYPYEVSETISIYQGNTVFPFNKKQLRKLFPARKADIDAWFSSGNSLPRTVDEARELLERFAD